MLLRARRLLTCTQDTPIENAGIIVDGERIVQVGDVDLLASQEGIDAVDLGEVTLLPGLIDMHVHLSGRRGYGMTDRILNTRDFRVLRAMQDCELLLQAGYTTVRDVGSEIALSLRRAANEGIIAGPRILAAGPMISQTGGHADHHFMPLTEAATMEGIILADGLDECRKAVRKVVRESADLVKICTTGGIGSERDHPWDSHYTIKEVTVIVEEAHRLGRRVAAHAQGREGIITAVKGGVDTIEHGSYLDEECATLMAQNGTYLVPTVALREVFLQTLRGKDYDMPPWRLRKQREAIPAIEKAFKLAIDYKLPIAAGSDFTGVPQREHGKNVAEPIAMTRLGLPASAAIRAATATAAEALGVRDQFGAIEPGLVADIIAVEGNPLENISCLQNVRFVMKAGRVVRHEQTLQARC